MPVHSFRFQLGAEIHFCVAWGQRNRLDCLRYVQVGVEGLLVTAFGVRIIILNCLVGLGLNVVLKRRTNLPIEGPIVGFHLS